jgi:hypothetical protein
MLYILYNLIREKFPEKIENLEVKTEEEGICLFCGRERPIVSKVIVKKVLNRPSNSGIIKSVDSIPDMCVECFTVFSVAGKIAPSNLAKATGSKNKFFVVSENEWKGINTLEDLENLPKGLWAIFFAKSGKVLPVSELHKLELSPNPKKGFMLNILDGANLIKIYLTPQGIREGKSKWERYFRKVLNVNVSNRTTRKEEKDETI